MARTSTIQLVVVTGSDNDAERLVSLLRNAGRVARAKRPQSSDDLARLLAAPQDLIVIGSGHPLSTGEALEQCRSQAPLVSVIVVTDEPAAPWFKAGAADVVKADDEERLVGAGLREVEQVRFRRQLDSLRQQLDEAEQRNSLLLSESDDAIAYIGDGMIIHANARFAERFGFTGADELDCASIVDLIAPVDLGKVKAMLKALANTGEACEFAFQGQRADATTFSASMQLCASNYDGEACTQLSVRELGSRTDAGGSVDIDPLTGLASRQRLEAELGAQLTQQAQSAGLASLVYFGIDDYPALRARHGLVAAMELSRALAEQLAPLAEQHGLLAACGEDGFGYLLAERSTDSAAGLAEQWIAEIAQRSYPTSAGELQCTVSAGVVGITTAETAPALLDQAFRSAQQVRDKESGNGVRIHKPTLQKRAAGSADDLDHALEEALEDGRFKLMFQPVISLRGADGEHYEVQLRALDDAQGDALNDESNGAGANALLAALRDADGNTRLDRWVILEATKQLAEQRQRGNDTRLLINLTGQVLRDASLLPWLGVAIKAGGMPAEALIFQCHTDDVAAAPKAAQVFAQAVRELGARFSLACFGTQERALSLLEQLSVDMVQLDGILCQKLQKQGDQDIVKELVSAASGRGIKVIVTEVENAAALATLWQVGADFIEGSYLQAPAPEMSYEFTDIA